MKRKPKVAMLRGPFLNSFEMQSYELVKDEFDITAFTPHKTYFDTSKVDLKKETLWCPIAAKVPFERPRRKWQTLKDQLTGNTHSFCGLVDRLTGFDIYHIMDQAFCFSYEAALAKRKYGGKLVVTEYENIPHLNERKFMESRIKKAVKEQADLFLAISQGARQALIEEGVPDRKIHSFSGAVKVDVFKPGKADPALRKSLGIPAGAFVVLYVGRLAESKGTFTLLEAAKRLATIDPSFYFVLAGKDEEGVAKWIEKNKLGSSVRLAGFVPYTQMPDYYRQADVFVLPSLPTKGWIEQFGYVLAEAMASGVAAVGSDCGAIPEVIGRPDRVFPPGSVEGLASVLLDVKKKGAKAEGRQARQRAVKVYSSQVLAKAIKEVYWKVLAG